MKRLLSASRFDFEDIPNEMASNEQSSTSTSRSIGDFIFVANEAMKARGLPLNLEIWFHANILRAHQTKGCLATEELV